MLKVDFPKTPDKLKLIWAETNGHYVGLAELKETIILYVWDGIALNWNERFVFIKAKESNVKETI